MLVATYYIIGGVGMVLCASTLGGAANGLKFISIKNIDIKFGFSFSAESLFVFVFVAWVHVRL